MPELTVTPLTIPDVLLISPPRFGDARGFFSETWSRRGLRERGFEADFVQDNHSLSERQGVVRGLHCQVGQAAQGKLVRVIRGAIWDVAVDIRARSPSFGQHVAAVISAENWRQIWVPPGFLHGFCTLEPGTEVIYKVTADYDRAAERGVVWNDATLGIAWPVGPDAAWLSDKDRALSGFAAAGSWFP